MHSSATAVFEWPRSWENPGALRRLAGTPFRTLLFATPPPAQLLEAASQQGFACVMEGRDGFRWRALGEMDWAQPGPCVAVNDAFWPSIATGKASEDGADAGPTGSPWLDANGWMILLARARANGLPVWIRAKDPESPEKLEPASYRLALAEASAYGAVRPLWLSPRHAAELAEGEPAWWKDLCAETSWWQQRQAWQPWPAAASLLIVSDFSGANEYLATETLLLAARRNLAFRPLPRAQLNAPALQGQKALLWLDPEEPPALVRGFVESGGLLICRKTTLSGKPVAETHSRFRLQQLGAGRVALAAGDWDDPWVLAQDVHLLMSRRYDPVRLFNPGMLQHFVSQSPDGTRQLVHIMNYTLRPSWNLVTLAPRARVRSARAHQPGREQPQPLEVRNVSGRHEIPVPRFPIALTIELELAPHA